MSDHRADLLDSAPETFRALYHGRMQHRRDSWRAAWTGIAWHHPHPEDALVDAHRVAWHEARAAVAGTAPDWRPTLVEEALLEVLLLGSELPLWASRELSWPDVQVALYRQAKCGLMGGAEPGVEPTPLGISLHRAQRVGLPKTLDRVIERAQEAAECLGERLSA